ncbi:hypothetical protein RND81_08G119500 [Saponaria officinalis]|uniref:Uncharacterized protein n=1 Tax=Saponaria officinalis TaxID=3572 RepID=A0AAW1J5Q8_SAPOF
MPRRPPLPRRPLQAPPPAARPASRCTPRRPPTACLPPAARPAARRPPTRRSLFRHHAPSFFFPDLKKEVVFPDLLSFSFFFFSSDGGDYVARVVVVLVLSFLFYFIFFIFRSEKSGSVVVKMRGRRGGGGLGVRACEWLWDCCIPPIYSLC